MNQKKAYKYRFYPSDEQKRILAHTFGCCRYVYNWALRQRTDAYYQHGERLSYEDTAQRLVLLKKEEETVWLNEVSSVPLQQALRHLDRAFRNFFEGRADYPTFKKKRHQQSGVNPFYRTQEEVNFRFNQARASLPCTLADVKPSCSY